MRCSQNWKVLVSAYSDGELDGAQVAQVRTHLGQCQTCRELLQQWGDNQSLFTWAYSQQIDEENTVRVKESPKVSSDVPEMKPRKSLSKGEVVRRSLAWAAVLVLCVLLSQWVVWSRMPSMGGEGSSVVTTSQIQKRRLVWGVTLNIGPNSQVMRTGPRSIKLIKGWVEASVTGRPIQISTKRVSITDMGTRFEVGSGPQLDYVKVSKGWVWVVPKFNGKRMHLSEDEVLLVNGRQMTVPYNLSDRWLSGPGPNIPIAKEKTIDSQRMLWLECTEQLHDRYPDMALVNGSVQSTFGMPDGAIFSSYGLVSDANKAVNRRYMDILRAVTGSSIPGTNWSMPTALLMVSGYQGSGIKGYLLELLCVDGKLQWILSDMKGNQTKLPDTTILDTDQPKWQTGSVWVYGISPSIWTGITRLHNRPRTAVMNLYLQGLPGFLKPVIILPLDVQPLAKIFPKEAAVKAGVISALAGRKDFTLSDDFGQLVYMDAARSNYFGIYWNQQLELQMKNPSNSSDVVVGVFTCTKPLLQPKLKAGAYTVHMKRTGLAPRKLYLAAAGSNTAEPQSVMLDVNADDRRGDTICSLQSSTYVSRGYLDHDKQLTVWMDIAPESKQKPRPSLAAGKIIIDNR